MNKLLPILLLLCVASGCSDSDAYMEFIPTASPIELVGILEQPDIESRAPINPGGAANITLFRADELPAATTFGAYAQATHGAIAAATGKITFTDTQYYQANPAKKSKLVAVYPRTTEANVTWTAGSRTVAFTSLDGQTDVLCSAVAGGSKDAITSMTFGHLLAQLEVSVVRQNIIPDLWGNITSITLKGTKDAVTVTLPDPSNATTAVSAVTGGTAKNYVITKTGSDVLTTSTAVYGNVMFPPVTVAEQLTLSVVTAKNTFADQKLTLQKYDAGKKYKLTLSFTAKGVEISSSSITSWTDQTSGTITL